MYLELFANFAQSFALFAVKKAFSINLILLLIVTSVLVSGQEQGLSETIIAVAEELAADDSDPEAAVTYIERLQELAENPVRMNSSGEDEISRLFFLSDFQVKALVDYVHSSGRIISVYEITNIPGFDKEIVEMMIPFIYLDNKSKMNTESVRWKNTVVTNLSIKTGSAETSSSGSQWKMLTRYRFTSGSFSGGLTAEKDPGEPLITDDNRLPDFLSANLAYNGSGMIRRIIVGDFAARAGLGTNINTGIRTGLSLTASGYMSARDEIKSYTSTDENNFFRGIAAEFSFKNLKMTLFGSKNYSDATLGSSDGISKDYIENFYRSGLHNTSSTIQKKDAISEQVYGINLSYNFKNIRIGFAWSEDRFSFPVILTGDDPEGVFDFKGRQNNLYTGYYNGIIKNILLYGEFSSNDHFHYALVQGLSCRPSDRLTINFLYRSYSAGYFSFHGKGPGSSSGSNNEKGILGNFNFEAAKHLFISGGCDIVYYPWLKYRCSSPSQGLKKEIRIRYLPDEKLTFDVSYCYRMSVTDNAESFGIPDQTEIITRAVKGTIRYSPSENITFGSRLDYKVVNPSGSAGMQMLQDLNYHFSSIPFTIWIRYCMFNTDSWDSRIYTYENDMLYSFSIPALSGEGSRSYFLVKWEIGNYAEMRFKYGFTSMNIKGNNPENKDEFKIQFRLWF